MLNEINILVVDDDPYLLDLLIETLSTIGYKASGAPDADRALKRLREEKFHLVITDIKMPGMDGFALAEHIRQEHPDLPIIFITGVFSSQIVKKSESDKILTKPFRIGQLEDLIKKSLSSGADKSADEGDILVVDDDDGFRLMLTETLKLSGYSVKAAAGAEEALTMLSEGGISAIITDFKMPGMNGLELLRRIKTKWNNLPVIVVTAYLAQDQAELSFEGADGFLLKPFKIENITNILESLKARFEKSID